MEVRRGMKICIFRVDDRLIHGQVTAVWTRELGVSTIFVVDDTLCRDRLSVNILSMTAPPKTQVHVFSTDQMASALRSPQVTAAPGRAMILFRDLAAAEELLARTGRICETLCLGGIPSRIGRHEIAKNLFLSKDERLAVLNIADHYGMRVISQVLPSDTPLDVGALIPLADKGM